MNEWINEWMNEWKVDLVALCRLITNGGSLEPRQLLHVKTAGLMSWYNFHVNSINFECITESVKD